MSATNTVQWTFQATLAGSSDACRAAESWGRAEGLEDVVVLRLALILEELFTNTVKYGYAERSDGSVKISLTSRGQQVELVYADHAPPFDSAAPTKIRDPDVTTGRVGGMGLRLIQKMGSNATYRRDNGWNILSVWISDTQGHA